jgi:hypothetical protein
MLDSLALAHPVQGYNARFHAFSIADTGPKAVRLLDRAHDQKASRTSTLDRHLEVGPRPTWARSSRDRPKYRIRRGLREDDAMEDRSSRRMRTLVTQMARSRPVR